MWLPRVLPRHVKYGFGRHHAEFWDWLWSIEAGQPSPSFVALWPRGGAKSTSAEAGCVAVGAKRTRRFILYVSGTQDQANQHVQNIGAMLESPDVEEFYPDLASRQVNKYGYSRGWTINRLRTNAGFQIDAIGLDKAIRGVRVDDVRPDLIILDDVDDKLDSIQTVEKKIGIITHGIIPAGSSDVAVLGVQNLVHLESIFARLADGRADFMADRMVSGPHQAIEDLTIGQANGRAVIMGGTPIWEGQGLAECQQLIDKMGLTAFEAECQHDVEAPPGGMFDHLTFRHCDEDELPPLFMTIVTVDPAVTDTDRSDANGIQVDSLAHTGTVYRRYSDERRSTPLVTLKRAILLALEFKAYGVLVETDQGGDTWKSTYDLAWIELVAEGRARAHDRQPNFLSEKAGEGHGPKVHRASQMLGAYERGKFVHVRGTHTVLEKALRRFPLTKPFDLVDAGYWGWWYLSKFQPPRTAQNQYAETRWTR